MKKISYAFTASLFALSLTAFAEDPPGPRNPDPTMTGSGNASQNSNASDGSDNPIKSAANGQPSNASKSSNINNSATDSRPSFDSLDTKGNGYFTRKDVKGNTWATSNFSKCDANHDGHVTQQEFAQCSK